MPARPTYRAHWRSARLFDLVASPVAPGVWLVVEVLDGGEVVKIRGGRRAYMHARVDSLEFHRPSTADERTRFLVPAEALRYGNKIQEEAELEARRRN
jgi:hypothetical protein